MKKTGKRMLAGVLGMSFLLLSACGRGGTTVDNPGSTDSATQSSSGEQVFSLVSASLGGTYYVVASGLSEVLTQNVDGLTVNNIVSQGSTANAIKVGTGEAELGITNYYSGMRAIEGSAPYDQAYDICGICALQQSVIQFNSLASSGINSMTDLAGKQVSIGPAGGGGALIVEEILPYWGLSMNDMTISYMSYADGGEALTDGRIDVNVPHGAPPLEAISTASVTSPISLISMEDDVLSEVLADYPYYDKVVIPGGTYAGIDEDVTSLGVQDILVCSADMDEELVYQMTKAIYENLDYIRSVHSSVAELSFDGYKNSIVPLHPGALRFYEEMGIELS